MVNKVETSENVESLNTGKLALPDTEYVIILIMRPKLHLIWHLFMILSPNPLFMIVSLNPNQRKRYDTN